MRRNASARSLAWTLPLLAVLLLAAGCAGVDDPDGWAAPTEGEDAIYMTVDSGELIAVAPDTFDLIWTFPDADEQECGDEGPEERDLDGLYGPPAVADGVVYFGAWDGNVYAIDAASGECLWNFGTGDPIIGGVIVDSGRVYAASTDKNLYVLDAETGAEIDRAGIGDVWSTPTLIDGTLFIGTMEGDLLALDAETLEDAWDANFTTNAGLLTDPTPINGSLVIGGIGGTLFAVDLASGEELWAFDGDNWFWGNPVADEESGLVYATNMDDNIYAINAETGDLVWEFAGEALFRAGAVMAGDLVVAVDDDGMVFGLDAASGQLIWNAPTETDESTFAQPLVLNDATVLLVARNGDIFTVDLETGRLTTVEVGG